MKTSELPRLLLELREADRKIEEINRQPTPSLTWERAQRRNEYAAASSRQDQLLVSIGLALRDETAADYSDEALKWLLGEGSRFVLAPLAKEGDDTPYHICENCSRPMTNNEWICPGCKCCSTCCDGDHHPQPVIDGFDDE